MEGESPKPANTPRGAVFLSYASQDAEAAKRICDALRAAGIEVWLDQSELRGGDAWDDSIRDQIKACSLFIPVISANAHARVEGYFRLEWKLAVDRSHRMAPKQPFLLPVAIDDTPQTDDAIPDRFRELQWTRLPGGQVPGAFAARVSALLDMSSTAAAPPAVAGAASEDSAAAPHGAVAVPVGTTARTSAASRRRGLAVGIALIASTLALLGLVIWRPWHAPAGANTAASPQQTHAGTSAGSATEESVAVLPFTDMSEKHDEEYFSEGLAEELIDALTKVPNLRVPARTSSFSFKGKQVTVGEIARALGVSHILEGSVRKSGDKLRITAQLVRADNGFHLWSQTYDRDTRDIFAVQDDIARSVSQQLQTTLLGNHTPAPQQSTSPQAYEFYLKARALTAGDTLEDLDHAVVLYHKALDLDPSYAPAWAWLAHCHTRRVAQGLDTSGKGYAEATAAANRAIALNPNIPEAYVALGTAHAQYELNWPAATEAFSKALALDPNNAQALGAHGHLSAATGRPGQAVEYFRRAVQADPLNPLLRKYLGRALHYARQPGEAAAELRAAIAVNPQFPGLHYELGRALIMSGDAAGANAAFQSELDDSWRPNGLPLGYAAIRDLPRARAALAALVARSAGAEFQVAESYAFLGDTEKTFEWLEKAHAEHDPGVMWSRHDALLASVASDPRFAAFLKRLGMPADNQE